MCYLRYITAPYAKASCVDKSTQLEMKNREREYGLS